MANEAFMQLLHQYPGSEKSLAVKDLLQKIILLGLWRSKFFEKSACMGETALRHCFNIDRYTESLSFSTLKPEKKFNEALYRRGVEAELSGFECTATFGNELSIKLTNEETVSIPFSINNQPLFTFEGSAVPVFLPIPFSIKGCSANDILVAKAQAVLLSGQGNDWYDLIWLVEKGIPLNAELIMKRFSMPLDKLSILLQTKIGQYDFNTLKQQVSKPNLTEEWSAPYFNSIVSRMCRTN